MIKSSCYYDTSEDWQLRCIPGLYAELVLISCSCAIAYMAIDAFGVSA